MIEGLREEDLEVVVRISGKLGCGLEKWISYVVYVVCSGLYGSVD
jgi:hypothetical protein